MLVFGWLALRAMFVEVPMMRREAMDIVLAVVVRITRSAQSRNSHTWIYGTPCQPHAMEFSAVLKLVGPVKQIRNTSGWLPVFPV